MYTLYIYYMIESNISMLSKMIDSMSSPYLCDFRRRGKSSDKKREKDREYERMREKERASIETDSSDMYIMKQDIIIHRCMTEFAAKDSVWAQTFLLETESNIHTRVAELVNP